MVFVDNPIFEPLLSVQTVLQDLTPGDDDEEDIGEQNGDDDEEDIGEPNGNKEADISEQDGDDEEIFLSSDYADVLDWFEGN